MHKNIPHHVCPVEGKNPILVCRGIDYGCDPEVLDAHEDLRIIKLKGSTQWSRVGERAYYKTQYFLVRISYGKKSPKDVRTKNGSLVRSTERWIIEEIVAKREPGSKWAAAVKELRQMMRGES